MDHEPADDRSALAKAIAMASVATTIAGEMVVPPLAGYALDRQLNTTPLFVILGAAAGLVLSIWHLTRLANTPRDDSR